MIAIQDLSIYFGDRALFKSINLTLKPKDKFGLIGKNGVGKTTLFKVITKELIPDEGKADYHTQIRIGHLKQHLKFNSQKSVKGFVMEVLDDLNELEQQMRDIEQHPDFLAGTSEKLLTQYAELTDLVSMINPAVVEGQAEQILKGLGFKQSELDRSIQEFSGGWQMRMELAKMLLRNYDYLLLDEPTNFLDIESIVWLEQYLTSYAGAFIIISHDRDFLDNTTKGTLELSLGNLYLYPKSYTQALVEKEMRMAQQAAAYQNQQRQIAEKERLIERFRAKASKASFAKSLQKELDRMDIVERDAEDTGKLNIQFRDPPRSGDIALSLKDIAKSYDDNLIFSGVDLTIERGEKVALVGRNGEGKSTLVKIITDQLAATEGLNKLGHNVDVGYFAQDQPDRLDGNMRVLDYLESVAPADMRTKVRSILGAFLFSGEDVEKYIKVLSGGEKTRLALAALLLKPYNFLILDEPTNHLDIPSKNILKNAIASFGGTILIISHDRFFLRDLTKVTYEMRDGGLYTFLGDIDYFLDKKGAEDFRTFEKGDKKLTQKVEKAAAKPELSFDEKKKLKRQVKYAERDIEKFEQDIAAIEIEMGDPKFYERFDSQDIMNNYNVLKKNLSAKTDEWEQLVEELGE